MRVDGEDKAKLLNCVGGRRGERIIAVMAAILSVMHMQRPDDLFGMPNGTPVTDRLIEASIQWAERIMERIDALHPK